MENSVPKYKMSTLVILKCKHHGETPFYDYGSRSTCRACILERRNMRRKNTELNVHDKKYNRKYCKDNPEVFKASKIRRKQV
jgi:hypothetical protein